MIFEMFFIEDKLLCFELLSPEELSSVDEAFHLGSNSH